MSYVYEICCELVLDYITLTVTQGDVFQVSREREQINNIHGSVVVTMATFIILYYLARPSNNNYKSIFVIYEVDGKFEKSVSLDSTLPLLNCTPYLFSKTKNCRLCNNLLFGGNNFEGNYTKFA